jgi:hypothetical protein
VQAKSYRKLCAGCNLAGMVVWNRATSVRSSSRQAEQTSRYGQTAECRLKDSSSSDRPKFHQSWTVCWFGNDWKLECSSGALAHRLPADQVDAAAAAAAASSCLRCTLLAPAMRMLRHASHPWWMVRQNSAEHLAAAAATIGLHCRAALRAC